MQMAPGPVANFQERKTIFSPVHEPFTRLGCPFRAHVLWSLWIKHFWQLLHQNLTSNTIGDCTLNYRGDLRLASNGWRQANTSLIPCGKQQQQVLEHLEDAAPLQVSFWNGMMTRKHLKHSKRGCLSTCIPSLTHICFESSFSSFHYVAPWYFPLQLLFCVVVLMNLIMPIPVDAESFIKHTISLTHQSVKWWFWGLNSSCWSNHTRQLLLNLQSNWIWSPFVQRHNFEGIGRLNIILHLICPS